MENEYWDYLEELDIALDKQVVQFMTMYLGSFREEIGKKLDLDKFLSFFLDFEENQQLVKEVEESQFMIDRFEEKVYALHPLI